MPGNWLTDLSEQRVLILMYRQFSPQPDGGAFASSCRGRSLRGIQRQHGSRAGVGRTGSCRVSPGEETNCGSCSEVPGNPKPLLSALHMTRAMIWASALRGNHPDEADLFTLSR